MKCQQCDKKATFHITEMTGAKPLEIHLCEQCAHEYLTNSTAEKGSPAGALAGALAKELALGQTATQLAELDQRTCPVCGISFYEFRKQGRLGCAHDYVCFAAELEPLIASIHGLLEHKGRHPIHGAHGTEEWTKLVQFQREMAEAVTEERYERASELRDKIRNLEARIPKLDGSSPADLTATPGNKPLPEGEQPPSGESRGGP